MDVMGRSALLALLFLLVEYAHGNCYATGGGQLQVCLEAGDEGMYYQTPPNRVCYNTQIINMNNSTYLTVHHSEAMYGFINNIFRSGDSIRIGAETGSWTYTYPPSTNFSIWGSVTDVPSNLYYGTDGVSGGGNPMMITGRSWAGDGYFYLFFITVHGGSDTSPNTWVQFLNQARTVDFQTFDVFSMDPNGNPAWEPFTDASIYWQQRPLNLIDTNGDGINGLFPDYDSATQGLIGSINIINSVYYYFYTDYDSTKSYFVLYYRTAGDVSQGWKSWSPATAVTSAPMPVGTLVRAAKAKDMDRWALLYTCIPSGGNSEDLCLQYTVNLNVMGSGGVSDIQFFDDNQGGHSSYFLGLASQSCANVSPGRGQQYFMTDVYGNLASPDEEPQADRGGIATWTDASCTGPGPYGAPVFRAGWQVTAL